MIAAAFHGDGKLICTAECRNEQRHEDRQQRLCALKQIAAVKIRAARLLRGHYLVRFLNKRRDESESHAHHHAHLVNRDLDLFERIEHYLKSVRERNGACRIRQHKCSDDQEDNAQRHHNGALDALPGYDPALNYRRSAGVENIQHRGEDDYYDKRL